MITVESEIIVIECKIKRTPENLQEGKIRRKSTVLLTLSNGEIIENSDFYINEDDFEESEFIGQEMTDALFLLMSKDIRAIH